MQVSLPLPPRTTSGTILDPSIWRFPTSFGRTPLVVMTDPPRSVLHRSQSSSRPVDQSRYFLEPFSRQCDLCHLEDGVAGVAHDLGTGFHELLPQAGAVAELVGIECGVVSGVFNLESSGIEVPDWRPRHDKHYHEA